jgi:diguanylate cyclase (GGDEF)-like protein
MFDIDQFKIYNDTYGHQQGDECIKKVAVTAESLLKRPSDFIARYGGEEFVIVLPETNQEGVLKIAETVRKGIEDLDIPHGNSVVAPVVTISLGIATMSPVLDSNCMQLIIDADHALYKAKAGGRNRIEM